MASSVKRGMTSLGCEVVSISPFGVWILVADREYFLDHKRYPWFRKAAVQDVIDVQSPRAGHLRWPALDVDLHVDSINNPERYPLVAASKEMLKRKLRRAKVAVGR